MDSLQLWVFRILCAATISGVLITLPLSESRKQLLRLCCGVFLMLTLLSGIPGLKLSEIPESILPQPGEIPLPVAEGEEMSADALRQLIIQETEAYILHKAAALEMDIRVDVFLAHGEYPVPESAVIQGTYTQEQKKSLSAIMEAELGIPEEDQRWIG